jgi:hypothetical protein
MEHSLLDDSTTGYTTHFSSSGDYAIGESTHPNLAFVYLLEGMVLETEKRSWTYARKWAMSSGGNRFEPCAAVPLCPREPIASASEQHAKLRAALDGWRFPRLPTSVSEDQDFPATCLAAIDDSQRWRVFRSYDRPWPNNMPGLVFAQCTANNATAEHTFGRILLGRVKAIEPKLLDCYLRQFAATDEVGSPSHVASYGLSHTLSCKTIQQMSDIASIVQLLGHALNCAHIIEIGGGYGGLAKNLIDVVRPTSYTIVDLPEALLLQSRFLSSFNTTRDAVHYVEFFTNQTNAISSLRHEYDLCISTSAFGELRYEPRKLYFDTIFTRCRSGYLLDTSWPHRVFSLGYSRTHMTHLLRKLGRSVVVLEPYGIAEADEGASASHEGGARPDSLIVWTDHMRVHEGWPPTA